MRTEIRRMCASCCPDYGRAFFEYDGSEGMRDSYRCRNCGHVISIVRRRVMHGTASQVSAVDQLVAMAMPRYRIDIRRSVNGRLLLGFNPRRWHDRFYSAWVGPRGGLVLESSARDFAARSGLDAWISARVFLGEGFR